MVKPRLASNARQADTLRMFTALRLLRPSWGGALLLGIGLDAPGRTLALASLAAGAASLFLEADAAHLQTAQREGACTFAVTTLDEALRALKNEIRQGRAISVAVGGDPHRWLSEMAERGVQPEVFASALDLPSAAADAVSTLLSRGTYRMEGFGLDSSQDSSNLEDLLTAATRDTWRIEEQLASSLAGRRLQDQHLFAATTGKDPVAVAARRWLRVAPTLFPRALERAYWSEVRC